MANFFLLFFRLDSSFIISSKDFVKLEPRFKQFTANQWNAYGDECLVDCEVEDGVFKGVVIQVAEDRDSLLSSLEKARDLRWKKKMSVSNLLCFFKRFKCGRDRLPPFTNIPTDLESDSQENYTTESCVVSSARVAVDTPTLLPLPDSYVQSSNICRDAKGQFKVHVEGITKHVNEKGYDTASIAGTSSAFNEYIR